MNLLDFLIGLEERRVLWLYRDGEGICLAPKARNDEEAAKIIQTVLPWIKQVMTPALRADLMSRLAKVPAGLRDIPSDPEQVV